MLVITADHGDELWEDGRVGHGGSERETLLHVPLLIHYPPLLPAGHVTEGVEDDRHRSDDRRRARRRAAIPSGRARRWSPLANGVGGYPLMSFSSQYENAHAGRIGHWKLKLVGTGAPRLYDLAKDPDERKDLYGSRPAEIGARLLLDPMWMLRAAGTSSGRRRSGATQPTCRIGSRPISVSERRPRSRGRAASCSSASAIDGATATYRAAIFTADATYDGRATLARTARVDVELGRARRAARARDDSRSSSRAAPRSARDDGLPAWPARVLRWRGPGR